MGTNGRVYSPDGWSIFHINSNGDHTYKIFGSWSGGYLDGDSWRLSSGTDDLSFGFDDEKKLIVAPQASGSTYLVSPFGYRRHNAYATGVIQNLIKSFGDVPATVEVTVVKLKLDEQGRPVFPLSIDDEVATYDSYYS